MGVFVRASFVAIVSISVTTSPLLASGKIDLPAIKVSPSNLTPQCATPGRLMAFLSQRNAKFSERYRGIATEYMRHGEKLKIRWDYAFFQMLVETGNLTYTGDVKPYQNNFAGLAATGHGVQGESFKDISLGVRAHLEHVLMYTGEKIQNPVAERTRNIQEWGVLTNWQKSIKEPITFGDLAKKWAPTSHAYAKDISSVALSFYTGVCKAPDPQPELIAEARSSASKGVSFAKVEGHNPVIEGKGAEIAKKAIADARSIGDGDAIRNDLGAGRYSEEIPTPSQTSETSFSNVLILNEEKTPKNEGEKIFSDKKDASQISSTEILDKINPPIIDVTGSQTATLTKNSKSVSKCNVWTASYGGNKAMIIKASADGATHYTVLDVNEGSEKKEAEAYITAYAKGGQMIGEYTSSALALDKAFELCPES